MAPSAEETEKTGSHRRRNRHRGGNKPVKAEHTADKKPTQKAPAAKQPAKTEQAPKAEGEQKKPHHRRYHRHHRKPAKPAE